MKNLQVSAIATQNELHKNEAYVAPAIETVMTPEQLEREVFYAGSGGPSITVLTPR